MDWRDWVAPDTAQMITAVGTAAAAVITMAFTGWQLKQQRQALGATLATLAQSGKSQRAWLLPKPWLFPNTEPGAIRGPNKSDFLVRLGFINIGQLPAFDARVTARVKDGSAQFEATPAAGRAYFVREQS